MNRPVNKISQEIEKQIIELLGTKPVQHIAEQFNISKPTVYRIAREYNKNPTYTSHILNRTYFDNVQTEHQAYWLGFIMADGTICKPGKTHSDNCRLQINISAKDIELLELFKQDIKAFDTEINTYIPKNTYSSNPMSKIVINSRQLCDGLKQYGISSNKTGNECIPNISKELLSHFIRGYFDGDGCITCNDKPIISFTCANESFLYSLKYILQQEIGLLSEAEPIPSGYQNNRKKHSFQISFGGILDVLNFYKYIYQNATIYLSRKYNKYTSLLS